MLPIPPDKCRPANTVHGAEPHGFFAPIPPPCRQDFAPCGPCKGCRIAPRRPAAPLRVPHRGGDIPFVPGQRKTEAVSGPRLAPQPATETQKIPREALLPFVPAWVPETRQRARGVCQTPSQCGRRGLLQEPSGRLDQKNHRSLLPKALSTFLAKF